MRTSEPSWRRFLALVLCPLGLLACGARESLYTEERSERDAATTTGVAGYGAGGAGGQAGAGGASVGGGGGDSICARWAVAASEPLALTDPSGDCLLTGLAAVGSRVFVATTNNNDPSPDPTWRVRVVSDDLSEIGPSQVVLSRPQSVSYSGLSLASGFDHLGGVAWSEGDGCRFVGLADDGSAATGPTLVDPSWCYWLSATPTGFAAFSSPSFQFAPVTWLALDTAGALAAKTPDVVPSNPLPTFPLSRAILVDSSSMVAWLEGSTRVNLRRFSTDGETLSERADFCTLEEGGRFAMGSLAMSFLTVCAPGGGQGILNLQTLFADAVPTLPVTTIELGDGTEVGAVAVAAAGAANLVAWTEGQSGAYHRMVLQNLQLSGSLLGSPIDVATPPFVGTVRIVITAPQRGLLVFDALEPGALTQVFALPLVCVES